MEIHKIRMMLARFLLLVLSMLISLDAWTQTEHEFFTQAKEKLESKKYSEAAKLFSEAINLNHKNPEYFSGRAAAYSEMQKFQSAFDDYTRAIELNRFDPLLYLARGEFLYMIYQFEQSITDYTSAINYANSDSIKRVALLGRGSSKTAIRLFESAIEDYYEGLKIDSLNTALMNNLAMTLDEIGAIEEATEYLKKIIQLEPDLEVGYANLGFQLSQQEKYEESILYFNKALEINPDGALMYNNRGFSKLKMGDIKGALKDITYSIKLFPGNSYAYKNKALVYINEGKLSKACKELEQAVELGFTEMYGPLVEELQELHCNK